VSVPHNAAFLFFYFHIPQHLRQILFGGTSPVNFAGAPIQTRGEPIKTIGEPVSFAGVPVYSHKQAYPL